MACGPPPSDPTRPPPAAPIVASPPPVVETKPWRHHGDGTCPETEADHASLRFGTRAPLDCPRPNTCRSNRKLLGASAEEIRAYLGAPLRCAGERWIYRLNGRCGTEHDLLYLLVIEGRVELVEHEHRFAE